MARGFLEDDKTKLAWNLPRVLLAKNRVKLLLNMLLIAGQAIPRGGMLTVDPVGEGETMGFKVTRRRHQCQGAAGDAGAARRRAPAARRSTPMRIQPFYTGLLAKDCGAHRRAWRCEGEAVVVTRANSAACAWRRRSQRLTSR